MVKLKLPKTKDVIKISLATNLIACMHLSYKMRQVGKKREAS